MWQKMHLNFFKVMCEVTQLMVMYFVSCIIVQVYYRKSFTGQYQAPTFRELKNEVRSYRDKVREDHLAHTGRVAVSWPKYTIETVL